MLTAEQIEAMTDDELADALKDNLARLLLNGECRRYAAGVASKSRRGGTKVRMWRVAKPDRKRAQELEQRGRAIIEEGAMLAQERGRRAHAKEARA